MTKREFIITDTPPKAWIVGAPQPQKGGLDAYLDYRKKTWNRDPFVNPSSLVTFGGAVCYDSFNNPSGKSDKDYVGQSILEHHHGSVLEHVVLNFAVASLPRSAQLELVRHRAGVAYSWRSTRFADNWIEFCVPFAMREHTQARSLFEAHSRYTFEMYCAMADDILSDSVNQTISKTLQRKRIKEAARDILGGCVGSDGLFSINARALRHVIALRSAEGAAMSIREFAWAIYTAALPWVPSILQDAVVIQLEEGGPPVVSFENTKV